MMLIHLGGWTREVPEGTAFLEAFGTTFKAWDAEGNELEVGSSIRLVELPWYRRITESNAVAYDN